MITGARGLCKPLVGVRFPGGPPKFCVLSSAVEHLVYTERVGGSTPSGRTINFGVWRSLVAHLVWDQGVQGSNPCTPTKF